MSGRGRPLDPVPRRRAGSGGARRPAARGGGTDVAWAQPSTVGGVVRRPRRPSGPRAAADGSGGDRAHRRLHPARAAHGPAAERGPHRGAEPGPGPAGDLVHASRRGPPAGQGEPARLAGTPPGGLRLHAFDVHRRDRRRPALVRRGARRPAGGAQHLARRQRRTRLGARHDAPAPGAGIRRDGPAHRARHRGGAPPGAGLGEPGHRHRGDRGPPVQGEVPPRLAGSLPPAAGRRGAAGDRHGSGGGGTPAARPGRLDDEGRAGSPGGHLARWPASASPW